MLITGLPINLYYNTIWSFFMALVDAVKNKMETHIMDRRQLMVKRIMVKVKPVGQDGQNGPVAQTGHQMAPNSNLPKLATR